MHVKRNVMLFLALLLAGVFFSLFLDFQANRHIQISPVKPSERIDTRENQLLWTLYQGQDIRLEDVRTIRKYVDGRYDCSDFRLQSVLRILYEYGDRLSPDIQNEFKRLLLDFKYWMTEPGNDGMCYWSENHQILFAAAEYLAGQLYPDEPFTNNGQTGRQHKQAARQRILTWLQQRWLYGFTEWYSNVYYVEDITPLANLVDFAQDEQIVQKSKIILDLLLYDMASQSYKGNFVTTMGRSYEGGKKSAESASTRAITEAVFGYDTDPGQRHGMDLNFLLAKNYDVPPVLRAIGRDTSEVVIKASNGLTLSELQRKQLVGPENAQIMMQWGMEAFLDPEVVNNSMDYINQHGLLSNEFLHEFTLINYTLLRRLNVLPLVIRLLNPQARGTAIQRANTYTFKTRFYSMYTAQNYFPGRYGDQHHIFGVTLDRDLAIFHNHPALYADEKPVRGNSPSFWVGGGRLPHSAQFKNVNLSIYDLPRQKGFMERRLIDYTHYYFPAARFEKVTRDSNRVFAQYGHVFIAILANAPLQYNSEQQELIQRGKSTCWITELSTDKTESFDHFVKRIRKNPLFFSQGNLAYNSNNISYRLTWGRDFFVNENRISTAYPRFDSPYILAEREAQHMQFKFQNHGLRLNFDKGIREFTPKR